MNNQFKNSIIKATRPGIIDVWNAFMVEGADFTQNDHDIPFSPTTATKLPTAIIDWVEARQIYKDAIMMPLSAFMSMITSLTDRMLKLEPVTTSGRITNMF